MHRPPTLRARHHRRAGAPTGRSSVVAVALAASLSLGVAACGDGGESSGAPRLEEADTEAAAEHDFHIPPGTGERLDSGEEVSILPRVLEARVGESIRIVNDDDRGHVVGVFYVGAGETLSQTFTSPGEFSGSCTVHTDGEFTLRVDE